MSKKILQDTSHAIIRTNPKLTTNIKIIIDSDSKLYLESFDANSELSNEKYKAVKVNPSSQYSKDVFNFYNKGKFPKQLAYEIYQGFSSTDILSEYHNQYEMFYSAGARTIKSKFYKEEIGFLSPLWINAINIPDYFVIFKVKEPVSINTKESTSETQYVTDSNNPYNFIDNIIKKSTILKTFSLKDGSNIGNYIRTHLNNTNFPPSTFLFNAQKEDMSYWNGISYDSGGFVNKGEYIYDTYVNKDKTILENDQFITKGLERSGVICANLLNLEFLFNDDDSENGEINRYFGLYVNCNSEGSFILNGSKFYIDKTLEPEQYPVPTSNDFIDINSNEEQHITNRNGVLLHVDNIESDTKLPLPSDIEGLASYFYVKDKEDNLYNIKTGSYWTDNQLRLSNHSVDISKFKGFKRENLYQVDSKLLKDSSRAHCIFTVNGNIQHGFSIKFYDGLINPSSTSNDTFIGEITSNENLEAGSSDYHYYSNQGTTDEIVKAMKLAFKNITDDTILLDATVNDNSLIVYSKVYGEKFNNYLFEVESLSNNYIESFPANIGKTNFIGGTNNTKYRLRVSNDDIDILNDILYVKTSNGYSKVLTINSYLDEYILDTDNSILSFNDFNLYKVIEVDKIKGVPLLNPSKQISLYKLYKTEFGRLGFYPIKDLDTNLHSTEYFDQGELSVETEEYNKVNEDGELISKSSHPDIIQFYEKGFGRLEGLISKDSSDNNKRNEIINEYDRLKENYIREISNVSKLVPYINKWVYKGGKDVRNKDYRLNVSDAFGTYNFSPSSKNFIQDPDSYTHEWYLLSKYPNYLSNEDFKKTWSYFDTKVYDNIEPLFYTEFSSGFFQSIDNDNFTDLFTVDRFETETDIIAIDKQYRYSTFFGGNDIQHSQVFFRGVKLYIKERADSNLTEDNKLNINYNLNKLQFIKNSKYNGYKFSSILIPHQNQPTAETPVVTEHPTFQIKLVENRKWKTITMLIFLDINYSYFDQYRDFIDRTLLYALKNNIDPVTGDDSFPEPYAYSDIKMQGAIDFINSTGNSSNSYIIKGMTDIYGIPTRFLDDIKLGPDGKYNKIKFNIEGGVGSGEYIIEDIEKIINNNTLIANLVTKDGSSISLPSTIPLEIKLKQSTYSVIDGGYQVFVDRMKSVSFANIFSLINNGDPDIVYETVLEDGTIEYNKFIVQLETPYQILKPSYVTVIEDEDKPVAFNLTDTIGYRLSMSDTARLSPYYRHSGYYEPKFVDIVKFEDPYITKGLDVTGYDLKTEYESKVYELLKDCNTQFKINEDFGIIKDYYYHKVNPDTPGTILELNKETAFKSVYPLINETGIERRDFYIFSSNWDQGYYVKHILKNKFELVSGYRSQIENKSFYGSKIMNTIDNISLNNFSYINILDVNDEIDNLSDIIIIDENETTIKLNIYIEKALLQYLYDDVYTEFNKYINPKYSYGLDNSIEDDVNEYIKQNILNRYKIAELKLYIKNVKSNLSTNYEYLQSTELDKTNIGFKNVKNYVLQNMQFSNLNKILIYNKILGQSYSIGLSVKIEKK